MSDLDKERAKRRSFAIISHPDAGKTTLTEKFLLYGGAIQMAGQVRAKGEARRTRSDFMAMEKDRGISVSASAMSFDFKEYRFNLVDTPGHSDFSEDAYRTLTAVDAAIMVIDVVGYSAHMACLLGAHIIKVKLPTDHIEQAEAKKVYDAQKIPVKTQAERVAHIVQCCFDGRRIVVFSGGAAKGADAVFQHARDIRDGGGNGSIIGRNSFQRSYEDALELLSTIVRIYQGKE